MEIQEGGKILGQGTYGCVFSPPLLCRNERYITGSDKTKLGKLSEYSDIKNEVAAAVDLGKDKRSQKYFVLPEQGTLCKPKPASEQRDPDVKQCEPLERYGEKDMVHYRMRYGGQSLHVTLYSDRFRPEAFPYFRFAKELLEAGSVLLLNGYVHFDLHGQNVLLDKEMHPLIIDFGKAFSIKKLTQETIDEHWTQYDASFAPEPPEITLIIAAHSDIKYDQCLKDMFNEKDGILNMERLLGIPRSQQIREIDQFWRTSKAAQSKDWLTLWKLYWPVFDSWSFGSMLLSILKRLLLSNKFAQSDAWANKHRILETVLRGLLHSSPRKRFDCIEALALYDPSNPIVTKGAGKRWLAARRTQGR